MIFKLLLLLLLICDGFGSDDSYLLNSEEETLDPNEEFQSSPVVSAISLSGGVSKLPCNISEGRDSVILVLWYRDHVPTPIYSYDARSGTYAELKEWAEPKILGNRANFKMDPHIGYLWVNNTRKSDEASYRCRVDYKKKTTSHFRVNLTVIEPVVDIQIQDSSGNELVGIAGPYSVGVRPTIVCVASGGSPNPFLTWWKNGEMIERSTDRHRRLDTDSNDIFHKSYSNSYSNVQTQSYEENAHRVGSSLQLEPLAKEDLRATYTCRAENHPLAPTKEASVEIDMNFGPESVEIRGLLHAVSAGRLLHIICEAKGSRPPATLTWWLDDVMLSSSSQVTSVDGKLSTSTLDIRLNATDEGRKLTCRAENGLVPSATMEHSVTLQVKFSPKVHLQAGASLDLQNIKEGDDVYFDCEAVSRPPPSEISWKFNNEKLVQDVSGGVMVVGKNLVLQKVSKHQAGFYTCEATNTEGSQEATPIKLNVQYAPVCKVEQTDVFGVGRLEKTTVKCLVEADPPAIMYRWAFNNSGEYVDIPVRSSQKSDLRYSPSSDLDYGTLLCWATNKVGIQKVPCTFTIFPAGKPDSVSECRQFNHTEESIVVVCEPGYSGGMNQSFYVEAWDDGSLRATDRGDSSMLQVSGLRPGTRYTLKIYAENSIGRSKPFTFDAFTLTDVAERRTATSNFPALDSSEEMNYMGPLFGALVGGVASLILLIISIVLFAKYKQRLRADNDDRSEVSQGGSLDCETTKLNAPSIDSGIRSSPVCDLLSGAQDAHQLCMKHPNEEKSFMEKQFSPMTPCSPVSYSPIVPCQGLSNPDSSILYSTCPRAPKNVQPTTSLPSACSYSTRDIPSCYSPNQVASLAQESRSRHAYVENHQRTNLDPYRSPMVDSSLTYSHHQNGADQPQISASRTYSYPISGDRKVQACRQNSEQESCV